MNTAVLVVTLNTTMNRVIIIQIRTIKERILTGILPAIVCMRPSLAILKLNTTGRRMETPWRTTLIPIIRLRKIIGICGTATILTDIIISRAIMIIRIIIIIRTIIGTNVTVVVAVTITTTTICRTMINLRRDMVLKRIKVDF
jgi:hypothetical protein